MEEEEAISSHSQITINQEPKYIPQLNILNIWIKLWIQSSQLLETYSQRKWIAPGEIESCHKYSCFKNSLANYRKSVTNKYANWNVLQHFLSRFFRRHIVQDTLTPPGNCYVCHQLECWNVHHCSSIKITSVAINLDLP